MQDTIHSYQDFNAMIKRQSPTAQPVSDTDIINPYQVNLYMEQLIYKMHHGEKLPQSLYEKVKQYQPDIELEETDKHPHKKLLISQLYPLLLQQKYQQKYFSLNQLPENTILFNMLYNIDSVDKEFQTAVSIPEQSALLIKNQDVFTTIPIAQTFITKYVKPQKADTLCYLGLYYSDDYIYLSRDVKFSSPKQLETLYPQNYISCLKMMRYETFVSQSSQLISRSITQEINNKQDAISVIEKSTLSEKNKAIIKQIVNKRYENFDPVNTNRQVKQIISYAIEFYSNMQRLNTSTP